MKIKIAVNLNRITVPYLADFTKAGEYFLKHGVEIEWVFKPIDVHGYTSVWNASVSGGRYILIGAEKLIQPNPTCEIDMFLVNENEWANPVGSQFPLKPEVPCGSCQPVNNKPFIIIPTYQSDHDTEITWVMICHETMHALRMLANNKGIPVIDVMDSYRENQTPNSPTGNFAQQWELLKPYLNIAPTYKYFKPEEIKGLSPKLVQMLDTARGLAGVPFRITSGYRTAQHNTEVGGVDGSSHTTGLAVDLAVADSVSGGKMLLGLAQSGFKRFGFYTDGHIHIDIAEDKPSPCYWIN